MSSSRMSRRRMSRQPAMSRAEPLLAYWAVPTWALQIGDAGAIWLLSGWW
jgi:hypothetical protein